MSVQSLTLGRVPCSGENGPRWLLELLEQFTNPGIRQLEVRLSFDDVNEPEHLNWDPLVSLCIDLPSLRELKVHLDHSTESIMSGLFEDEGHLRIRANVSQNLKAQLESIVRHRTGHSSIFTIYVYQDDPRTRWRAHTQHGLQNAWNWDPRH